MKLKLALYFICVFAICGLTILLNELSISEGLTVGVGDLILRNTGLIYICISLKKYFFGK